MPTRTKERSYYVLRSPGGFYGKSQSDGHLAFGLKKEEHAFQIDNVDEVRTLLRQPLRDLTEEIVNPQQVRVYMVREKVTEEWEEVNLA